MIKNKIIAIKHPGKNVVEEYLRTTTDRPNSDKGYQELISFFERKYKFKDVRVIVAYVANIFLRATDRDGTELFIKSGHHSGLYENEFQMTRQLYNINPRYFLKPLYYQDFAPVQFFANEYIVAPSLETMIRNGVLGSKQRHKFIRDIYQIFLALKDSDVIHRDIRPANFLVYKNRLILIDFQLAVSKTEYRELQWMREKPNRLRKLGGNGFKYKTFVWDDSYSLLKVLEFVGSDKLYADEYQKIHREIKSYIGTNTIRAAVRESAPHRLMRHIRH